MSIIKDHKSGTFTAVCDECHDVIEEDCEDFREAVSAVKANKGKVAPDGDGGWTHICRDCV